MRYSYYSKVDGSIIFVDISNPSSIDDLRMIYDGIKDSSDNDPIIVIGALTADLRDGPTIRKEILITKGYIQDLSEEFSCEVFECSAKTNLNIDNLIHTLAKKILNEEVNFKGEWNIGIVSVNNYINQLNYKVNF